METPRAPRSQSLQYPLALATRGLNPKWLKVVRRAAPNLDPTYCRDLEEVDWLPGPEKMFSVLHKLPVCRVKAVLIGESPYPRASSANGEAFHDSAVGDLWSESGLSKSVNCATSLRNLIKMLLVAEELLSPTATAKRDIAMIKPLERQFVGTISDLFDNFRAAGILCINATPVLTSTKRRDVAAWVPFMRTFLKALHCQKPDITFLAFGKFAQELVSGINGLNCIISTHPYNGTFVNETNVVNYFRPLRLLRRASR